MEPERDSLQSEISALKDRLDLIQNEKKEKDQEIEKLTKKFNEKIKALVNDNNELKKLLLESKTLLGSSNKLVDKVTLEKQDLDSKLRNSESDKRELVDLLSKLASVREQDAKIILQQSQDLDKFKYEIENLSKALASKNQEILRLTETLSFVRQNSSRSESNIGTKASELSSEMTLKRKNEERQISQEIASLA